MALSTVRRLAFNIFSIYNRFLIYVYLFQTFFAQFSQSPYFLALEINELSTIIGSKDLSSTSSQKEDLLKAACDWLKYDLNLRRIYGPFLSEFLQSFHSIKNEDKLRWMQNIAKKDDKRVTVKDISRF